jgi:hypothetical protein
LYGRILLTTIVYLDVQIEGSIRLFIITLIPYWYLLPQHFRAAKWDSSAPGHVDKTLKVEAIEASPVAVA